MHKLGQFTGELILGVTGIAKYNTPAMLYIMLSDLGFADLHLSRVAQDFVRMGKILEPGEEGHPATATRPRFENCSECGEINFKHGMVTNEHGQTGPCTFSENPAQNRPGK